MLEKNVGLLMSLYQTLLKKTKSHKQSFAVLNYNILLELCGIEFCIFLFKSRVCGADVKDGPDREGPPLEEVFRRVHLVSQGRDPRALCLRLHPLHRAFDLFMDFRCKNDAIFWSVDST